MRGAVQNYTPDPCRVHAISRLLAFISALCCSRTAAQLQTLLCAFKLANGALSAVPFLLWLLPFRCLVPITCTCRKRWFSRNSGCRTAPAARSCFSKQFKTVRRRDRMRQPSNYTAREFLTEHTPTNPAQPCPRYCMLSRHSDS
jgi:hypothetical protein